MIVNYLEEYMILKMNQFYLMDVVQQSSQVIHEMQIIHANAFNEKAIY